MPFSLIPFLLLVIPMAEIAMFVVVGQYIGVAWTLLLILATAILGSILLRVQGFGLIRQIQGEMNAGRVPGRELVHGVMILVAGILLLTPGFITDTMGFLLFLPPVRDAVWAFLRKRVTFETVVATQNRYRRRGQAPDGETIIDLDESEFERKPDPASPWRKGKPDA